MGEHEILSGPAGVILALAAIVAIALLIGLPGKIARDRGHPSATAIQWCGIFGIILWPLWFVALVWALTGESNRQHDARRSATGCVRARNLTYVESAPRAKDSELLSDPDVALWAGSTNPANAHSEAASTGPGTYRITGVDRETRMDTEWYVEAQSEANAKAKAELEGIIITRIERA